MDTVLQMSSSPKSSRVPDQPFDSPTASSVSERKKVATGFDGKMSYNYYIPYSVCAHGISTQSNIYLGIYILC